MADGTQFQIDIDVPSGGTSTAADAVARLAAQLEEAGAAATAAADAVKAGEAAYSQAEKAASRAALAVEKIGQSADAQRGKLAAALQAGDVSGAERAQAAIDKLTQRQAEAVTKAEAAKAALAGEAAALDKLRAAAKAAEGAEEQLEKAHTQADSAAKAQKKTQDQAAAGIGKVNEIAEGLGKLGGPLGQAGQKAFGAAEGFKKLGSSLGSAGPYVAVAVAIVAIATAAIVATAALTAYVIKLSDAADTQSRLYAGMVDSVKGGTALEGAVNKLASRVPLTNEKLRSMASELAKTGLRGQELEDALTSAAEKASEAEFGPEWAKQVNSLSKQSELFQLHLSQLFRLKTDGLQAGLAKLVALFDETSTTGKAIKVVFDSLMQPLIDGLTDLIPIIIRTFIQFEIWALRALIAIKPYGSQIKFVAEAVATLAAVVVGVLVVAFAVLATASVAFIAGISFAFKILADTIGFVIDKVSGVVDWLKGLSLTEIGTALVEGLVNGITGGSGAIVQALTGGVSAAIDGAKKLLGIASPSRVFAEIGANTTEGMVQGIDAGAGDVQGSLEALVTPPAAGAPVVGNTSSTTSAGGNVFNFTINGGDAKAIATAIRDEIQAFFDGAVDSIGAGEAQAK